MGASNGVPAAEPEVSLPLTAEPERCSVDHDGLFAFKGRCGVLALPGTSPDVRSA
jgi:hypothetical protein